MKQYQKLLSLILSFAIAFPASSFAQNPNSSLQTYLDQPHQENVEKASKISEASFIDAETGTISKNFSPLAISSLLTGLSWVVMEIAAGDTKDQTMNRRSWKKLSELEILNNSNRLEKYLRERIRTLRASRWLRDNHGQFQAENNALHYDIIKKKFAGLDEFFTKLDELFHIYGITTSSIDENADEILKRYLRNFSVDHISLNKSEALDIIRCLSMINNLQSFNKDVHYKNLLHTYKLFGLDTTAEVLKTYHVDVFLNENYEVLEKELVLLAREGHLDLARHLSHTKDQFIDLRIKRQGTTDLILQTEVAHEKILKKREMNGHIRRASIAILIGVAVAGLIYWEQSKNPQANILEQHNLDEQEFMLMAENDPPAFVEVLKKDKILAATFAWLYDQFTEAEQDLKEFDQLVAETQQKTQSTKLKTGTM